MLALLAIFFVVHCGRRQLLYNTSALTGTLAAAGNCKYQPNTRQL